MATAQITQSMAYMSWILFGALALGSFALAWLLRQVSDATKGFLGFTAITAALLGLLWLLVDTSLPPPVDLEIVAAPGLDGPRFAAIAAFALLAFVAGLRLRGGGSATWAGTAAILAGVAAMTVGALGWGAEGIPAVPLLVQLLALAAVTGGSLAGVILAHWYLVTPRLSARPLILTTRLLTVAIAIQVLLFLAWQVVSLPVGPPLEALFGGNALFGWLRLTVGLLFPLVLAWLAYRTALTRSMESATGLLYIELAAVLASTIVAGALAVSIGLLV